MSAAATSAAATSGAVAVQVSTVGATTMQPAAMQVRRHQLTEQVAAFLSRAEPGGDGEVELERLALEVFAFQFEAIAPYQRLCRSLGVTPDRVTSWKQIPAVPAEAFKAYSLFAGEVNEIERTFRSSGTTDPARSSQAHFSRGGLELMNAAVAAGARRALFPEAAEGRGKARVLVLAPSPEQAPHMIMVHGMAHLMQTFGLPGSRFMLGPKGLDFDELWGELQECQRGGVPVALFGSSFGFVHFFDWMVAQGKRLALPDGSRLMDAGGYKGRSREISRGEFIRWASEMCGVPAHRVVNLLGMTELASQLYDLVGRDGARCKLGPPWMRTLVVDPRRSARNGVAGPAGAAEVAVGEHGLLRHLDLANVERPLMVQSEDVGTYVVVGGVRGFEILGRAKGAEPRGCSLSADDLQSKQGPQQGQQGQQGKKAV